MTSNKGDRKSFNMSVRNPYVSKRLFERYLCELIRVPTFDAAIKYRPYIFPFHYVEVMPKKKKKKKKKTSHPKEDISW